MLHSDYILFWIEMESVPELTPYQWLADDWNVYTTPLGRQIDKLNDAFLEMSVRVGSLILAFGADAAAATRCADAMQRFSQACEEVKNEWQSKR